MAKPYNINKVTLTEKQNIRPGSVYMLSLYLTSADTAKHLVEIALTNIDVMPREETQMRRLYIASENCTTVFEFEISKETYETMRVGSFEVHCTLREHIELTQYRDYKEKILLQNGRLS